MGFPRSLGKTDYEGTAPDFTGTLVHCIWDVQKTSMAETAGCSRTFGYCGWKGEANIAAHLWDIPRCSGEFRCVSERTGRAGES